MLFAFGGPHEKHARVTWNLGMPTNYGFSLGPRKTTKTFIELASRWTFYILASS
jgi:hypothetical protein